MDTTPDKYALPDYVISRVRYYNGQFLKEQDFIDDQKYHIDRQRRLGRLLHVAGVADGLDVTLADGGRTVNVAAGTAIDDQGRLILLAQPQSIAVPSSANGTQYVVIAFSEAESTPSDSNSAVQGNVRFSQGATPASLAPAVPSGALVLAKLAVVGGVASIVPTNERLYSGLRMEGSSVISLRAKGDLNPGWAEIGGSLSVTGDAAVAGGLTAGGALKAGGGLTVTGGATSLQGAVNATGNVGIGAEVGTPRGRLDLGAGGLNKNLRLGDYLDVGETDYTNFFYLGINAVLTTSTVPGTANKFSPTYAQGAGALMVQSGGGNGDIDFYGIDWKGAAGEKVFPTDFTHVMRINHDGKVGVATGPGVPGARLEVRAQAAADGSLFRVTRMNAGNGLDQAFVVGNDGTITAGTGYGTSHMAYGSLTLGNINATFGGGSGWNASTAGLLLETSSNTEVAAHDYGTRVASLMYYEGKGTNRVTIGRDMGWGALGSLVITPAVTAGSSVTVTNGLTVLSGATAVASPFTVTAKAPGSVPLMKLARMNAQNGLDQVLFAGNDGTVTVGGGYATGAGYMAYGSLTIGSVNASFGGGTSWNPNTAGLLLETLANTEIAVHDANSRVASLMYYEGDALNRVTIGRDMGWGTLSSLTVSTVMYGPPNDYVKAQFTMSGGGTVTWAANRLKWTNRFIAIAAERGKSFSVGYVDINMPGADIPGAQVFDGNARSVNGSGILLNAWDALYAVHNVGGDNNAMSYRVQAYNANFQAPSNWLLVAVVNGDDGSVKLGTGAILAKNSSLSRGGHIPTGTIVMWYGASSAIPDGWVLCDGGNGTPDLRDRFIVGAGASYPLSATGGEAAHTLSINEMPSHVHQALGSGKDDLNCTGGNVFNGERIPFMHSDSNDATVEQTRATGGGAAHENRPPYYALFFIMKQ